MLILLPYKINLFEIVTLKWKFFLWTDIFNNSGLILKIIFVFKLKKTVYFNTIQLMNILKNYSFSCPNITNKLFIIFKLRCIQNISPTLSY